MRCCAGITRRRPRRAARVWWRMRRAAMKAPASRSLAPFKLIGELINHSFARAAKAWKARDVRGYQELAKTQADLGAEYLTLNIDGTQSMRVTPGEMYDFLPEVIPAIQEATKVPIAFDNPSVE